MAEWYSLGSTKDTKGHEESLPRRAAVGMWQAVNAVSVKGGCHTESWHTPLQKARKKRGFEPIWG